MSASSTYYKADMKAFTMPDLVNTSSGVGLRAIHHEDVLRERPNVGFLEVHSENFFHFDAPHFKDLMILREDYPISLHCIGLSLGSADGLDKQHVEKLKQLIEIIEPASVSEHVSWSRLSNITVPDLLPMPMIEEALEIMIQNTNDLQESLGRKILMENPSSYLAFNDCDMTEPEFLTELSLSSGCGLLLDVNNIYVSAHNLGFDAEEYLRHIPAERVAEIHLAGYQINPVDDLGDIYIDAHNNPVHDPVWDLYEKTIALIGDKPTLIEWDNDLPSLEVLVGEAHKADKIRQKYIPSDSRGDNAA